MSTKPTLHAEWDTNNTNVSATTSGHKSDGWANNEIPPAAEFNYWQKQVSDWTKWLLESELNDGNVDYSLTADQADWDPVGGGTTTNVHTINVTPDAEGRVIKGLVGGVDKREIEIINASGTYGFFLRDQSTAATASNRYVFPPHLVVLEDDVYIPPAASVRIRYRSASTRWHVVETCGVMYYRKLIVPAIGGSSPNTASPEQNVDTTGHIVLSKGGDGVAFWYNPVHLPIGARIEEFRVYVKKLSTGGTTINASLIRRTSNSDSTTTVATDSENGNAPGYTQLLQTALGHVVAATSPSEFYYIQVTSNDADTDDWLLNTEINGWFP